jgi:hypothetical protein
MLRSVVSSFALALALGGAPALADPTPAPSETPAAAPAPSLEPSPAAASPAAMPSEPAGTAAPATPGPAPSVDQAVTVRAMDWLRRFQTGNIDRTQLSVAFNTALTPATVKGIGVQLHSLGPVKRYAFVADSASHGVHGYEYRIDFAAAPYVYLFEVDSKDDVAGILLTPVKR